MDEISNANHPNSLQREVLFVHKEIENVLLHTPTEQDWHTLQRAFRDPDGEPLPLIQHLLCLTLARGTEGTIPQRVAKWACRSNYHNLYIYRVCYGDLQRIYQRCRGNKDIQLHLQLYEQAINEFHQTGNIPLAFEMGFSALLNEQQYEDYILNSSTPMNTSWFLYHLYQEVRDNPRFTQPSVGILQTLDIPRLLPRYHDLRNSYDIHLKNYPPTPGMKELLIEMAKQVVTEQAKAHRKNKAT